MAKPIYDVLSSFEAGMNSGVEPLLLQKNQLANLVNGTVRGGYVTHRPPKKKQIVVWSSAAVQTAVEIGRFQGAGVYRRPEAASQILAQISGRIFRFTVSGASFYCDEITITGDANSATEKQAWIWQAERWAIISDGSGKLPIFYDGNTCRRSMGPSQLLNSVKTGPYVPPAAPDILEEITMELNAPWEFNGVPGPFNMPVIIGLYTYEAKEATSTPGAYRATISSATIPNLTVQVGDKLISYIGTTNYTAVTAGEEEIPAQYNCCAGQPGPFPATPITVQYTIPAGTTFQIQLNC